MAGGGQWPPALLLPPPLRTAPTRSLCNGMQTRASPSESKIGGECWINSADGVD